MSESQRNNECECPVWCDRVILILKLTIFILIVLLANELSEVIES